MKAIEQARAFIQTTVQDPALMHPLLDDTIKNRVRNSDRWLKRFQRVGDLLIYLQRFQGRTDAETYKALKEHGLATFEDIVGEFTQRFGAWANDRTTPASFVIGQHYSTFDILIFVGAYDTRAGGMFLLGNPPQYQAVVIKATFDGGRYPNAWIERHRRLKYYLKSRGAVFGEHFQENAAILQIPNIPILTFVRSNSSADFTYEGVFRFMRIERELDGSKWFELARVDMGLETVVDESHLRKELAEAVEETRNLSDSALQERLGSAPRIPKQVTVNTTTFIRNPAVIVAVLKRSKGICEDCGSPAPFLRRSDGTPYLEVHHRVQLANGGEDTVENAVAVCPNCHRKAHFG